MSKKPKNPVSDEQENKEWGGSANRVVRGGFWNYSPNYLRSAQRYLSGPGYRHNGLGFRIVKNIPKKDKKDE